jgi:molybdenum cofactor cytidylyltransferase
VTLRAVILAAGRGERLGGVAKALLPLGGTTYLGAIVATARAAGAEAPVVVVAAPFGAEVAEAARALGAEVVENPAPERGMGSSVGVGFGALAHGTRALLWPVDHPRVTLDSVRALLAVDADVVVPRVGGRGGHPVVVARAVWPALASLATGGIARDVLI